jgi:WD40 repeat protein
MPRKHYYSIGHTDRVWHLAWHPKEPILASCSSDKTICMWGKEGNKWVEKAVLENGHDRTVRRIAFSPDGKHLASASFDAKCCIWEYDENDKEWRLLATLDGHENEVKGVSWDASGTLLATCSRDKTVWIWEFGSDKEFECVGVLSGHTQDVKAVQWHPSKEMLMSCSYDDTIKVWLDDGEDWYCAETLRAHSSTVWDFAFDRTGLHFVSCGDDKCLVVWTYSDPPDGKKVGDDGVKLWNVLQKIENAHQRTIYSVDWSWTSNLIASAGSDDTIRIFQQNEKGDFVQVEVKTKAHRTDVNCVRWCPTVPSLLASASDDNTVKLWSYNQASE